MQQQIAGQTPVHAEIVDGVGYIRLDRPAVLNALAPDMIDALAGCLSRWRDDPAVGSVVMRGAGGKAFSAGADVRAMREHAVAGEHDAIRRYFEDEYALDLMLARYPKDCLAVVDGICFGGGMALAVHSRAAIASEHAVFSMPETLIGFFPDAGATHFLSRLPGCLGLYLGMTGARIDGQDAVSLGLASHFVPRDRHDMAVAAFAREGRSGLAAHARPPRPLSLEPHLGAIDACFGADTVQDICRRLARHGGDWAGATLETLKQRSPASLGWTLASLRRGRNLGLEECLAAELDLVGVSTAHPDFAEGVRAALVDKDKSPRWRS